jgi:hypothetical protein
MMLSGNWRTLCQPRLRASWRYSRISMICIPAQSRFPRIRHNRRVNVRYGFINGHSVMSASRPLYPRKQTSLNAFSMSAKGHYRTHAVPQFHDVVLRLRQFCGLNGKYIVGGQRTPDAALAVATPDPTEMAPE